MSYNSALDSTLCPFKKILLALSKSRGQPVSSEDVKINYKKRLHKLTEFFISETWKIISPNFSLDCLDRIYKEHPKENLSEYFDTLKKRNSSFAWAWIRARITDTLYAKLDFALREVSNKFPKEWVQYRKLLLKNGHYWFRQSQKHHLKLGYHTAISVICKLIGTKYFDNKGGLSQNYNNYIKECSKVFASFDLELLTASDNVLWNSAGASDFCHYEIIDNELRLPESFEMDVKKNLNDKSKHIEPRIGCPAIKSGSVFDEFFDAVVNVFRDIL